MNKKELHKNAAEIFKALSKEINLESPDFQIEEVYEKVHSLIFDEMFKNKKIIFFNSGFSELKGKLVGIDNPESMRFIAEIDGDKKTNLTWNPTCYYGFDFCLEAKPQKVELNMKLFEEIVQDNLFYMDTFRAINKGLTNNPEMDIELVSYSNGHDSMSKVRPVGSTLSGLDVPFEILMDPQTKKPLLEENITCSLLDMKRFNEIEKLVVNKIIASKTNQNENDLDISQYAKSLIYTEDGEISESVLVKLTDYGKNIQDLESDLFFILSKQQTKMDKYALSKELRNKYNDDQSIFVEHLAETGTSMLISDYEDLTIGELVDDNLYGLPKEDVVAIKEEFKNVLENIIAHKSQKILIPSSIEMGELSIENHRRAKPGIK